jgi:hypothetical protein
VRKVL